MTGKWANTASAINAIAMTTTVNTFSTGEELVVLGWDPAATHTTNFWTELATVTSAGNVETLETSTFTAKKYLWVQAYIKGSAVNRGLDIYVNSDTGQNYAYRYSDDGAADGASSNQRQMLPSGGYAITEKCFINAFIINNSANEKLAICHTVSNNGLSGAANAPLRREVVGKWVTTGSQITKVGIKNREQTTGQKIDSDSIIKVWGSD